MKNKIKKIIYAISLLAGTIIGVGLFSFPYIAAQVGLKIFLIYFFILGVIVLIIHLLFGEVALNTPDYLRFSGFAKTHLGKVAEKITSFSVIFSLLGSLLAYLIVGGKFLYGIFSPFLIKEEFFYVILYFVFGSFFIYIGLKAISKIEFLGIILFFLILFLILIYSIPFFKISNLTIATNPKNIFLPYGPILYALWGAALIPDTEEVLKKEKRYLRKVIFISILIPIFVYLVFTFLVLGIAGKNVDPQALLSLENIIGKKISIIALFFGFLTTFTSYIALGLTLKKMFTYDYKLNINLSWAIVCFVPLFLYFLGFKNFIDVISFVGSIFLGISGIMIILMYQKVKKSDFLIKIITPLFILVFLVGIIYQILFFFKK